MATNRGVAYMGPGKVDLKSIDYPKLKMPASETNPFGVTGQEQQATICSSGENA